MHERDEPGDDATGLRNPDDEVIARLLRAAGPRPEVPAERAGRVRATVHERWRRAARTRGLIRWVAWGGAAALATASVWMAVVGPAWRRPAPAAPVVPVAVATLERAEGPVTWIGMEAPAVGAALRAGSILETGAEGRAAVLLRTGVALRADAGTHLRLESAVEIGLDRGAVYLDTGGRAGPVPAVAVRTPLGMVRDVGTRFEVRLGEDAIQVSVRAGRVRLERPDGSHETPSGVRLTVRGDGAPVRRAVAAAGPEWDWVQRVAPPFRLEGRRLDEYLAWFGSETGLRIEYGDPAIAADAAAVVLHGSIEGLLPGDTLEAVLPTCGLRHRVAGERVILERAAPGEHSVTSRPLSPRGTERQGGVR